MIDIQAGDVVVHVDGSCPYCWEDGSSSLVRGKIYKVASIKDGGFSPCPIAITIEGFEHEGLLCPHDFRKVQKCDEGFATWMKSLRPTVKTRVDA